MSCGSGAIDCMHRVYMSLPLRTTHQDEGIPPSSPPFLEPERLAAHTWQTLASPPVLPWSVLPTAGTSTTAFEVRNSIVSLRQRSADSSRGSSGREVTCHRTSSVSNWLASALPQRDRMTKRYVPAQDAHTPRTDSASPSRGSAADSLCAVPIVRWPGRSCVERIGRRSQYECPPLTRLALDDRAHPGASSTIPRLENAP